MKFFKMLTEVPVLQRCCFCLPLRRSLIGWGYFKLIFAFLMVIYFTCDIVELIGTFYKFGSLYLGVFIAFIVLVAVMILDAILHIIFLIGAHKKDTKFMRVYYFYSITVLVLTTLLLVITAGLTIKTMFDGIHHYIHPIIIIAGICVMFINLVVHAYVLLLIRSEIIKLDNIGSFTFVNNAAKAECNLILEQGNEFKEESNINNDERAIV